MTLTIKQSALLPFPPTRNNSIFLKKNFDKTAQLKRFTLLTIISCDLMLQKLIQYLSAERIEGVKLTGGKVCLVNL